MKWGQCDKKLTTAQRILSPSLVCAWLVMRKLVSPTIVFVWYTASIVNTGWVSSEECERVFNVYFCTQICVTIKSKLRMSGKNQHREKKPYKLSMCQSVSNGFLLKWNQHEAPADTWSTHKRKMHCTQKGTLLVEHTLTADLSTKRLWLRWKDHLRQHQPPKNKIINEWEENMFYCKTHEK